MSMGRGGLFGNPKLMPWDEEIERQRQRIEAEMGRQTLPDERMRQIDPLLNRIPAGIAGEKDVPNQVNGGGLIGGQQQPQQGFWQGGEKFRAKDGIAALLAAIGDGLSQANGGQAWATRNLAGGRFDAMEEAKKRAKEQELLQQAYATAGRLNVSPDLVDAKRLGVPLPEKRKPHVFEDNAGNLMEYDFETGQERVLSRDPQERVYFNNGAMVTIPNARRGMAQPSGGPPPEAIRMLQANPQLAPQFQQKYGVDPNEYLRERHTVGSTSLPIPRLGNGY